MYLKILCFVVRVEDHHKLIKVQFLIQPRPPRQSDVGVHKNITCLSSYTLSHTFQ
jgi:hypothetical protein